MLKKKYFYPKYPSDLIRIGDNSDGGYIFNKKIIFKIHSCLSFGLGDNFSFEKELKKINSKIKIHIFDHTVNYKFWIRHFFYWLWKSIRYRKYLKFLNFVNYNLFFNFNNNVHYKYRIGTKNHSLTKIINKLNLDPQNTLLKIDIDGDEYKIIDEIKKFSFLGLIIEFENSCINLKKIEKFIKDNKKLVLIHIHANNFSTVIEKIPNSIELSFINKKFIKKKKINKNNYPIKNLDYPNNIMKKDVKLFFKEQ